MAKRRKSGEGTVRLRKDGRWEGRIVIGYDERGLPKTRNVLGKTKTKCLEKLEKLKEEYRNIADKMEGDMDFGVWMDFWYNTYSKPTLSLNTRLGYEDWIYNHIIPKLGKIPLNKISQNDLQQFYAMLKKSGRLIHVEKLGEGLSDRMVRSCHQSCRSALDKAVAEGLIKENPALGCKLPPKRGKEMRFLTKEEIQRFLIQARYEGYYELFLLELATGMRRGEILGLQWEDLDYNTGELHIKRQVSFQKGKFHISTPKTKSSLRTVILPPALVDILLEYKKEADSIWIFPSPKNKNNPRNPTAVGKRLKIILERADCKDIRFHDLRHTFATMALERGMDIKTLSATIGHVSAATTLDIYSHVTDNMQRQAADNIDRRISKYIEPQQGAQNSGVGQASPVQGNDSTAKQKGSVRDFVPRHGKIRRAGTGCISKINDNLYEGRYSPRNAQGKRISRNVYGKTREECEKKLAMMIEEMKSEIEREKNQGIGPIA